MLYMCLNQCEEHFCANQRLQNLSICIDTHAACTLSHTSASDTMCCFVRSRSDANNRCGSLFTHGKPCDAMLCAGRLQPHCSSQKALLQQTSKHLSSSVGSTQVQAKKNIHTCVYTRIHSANRHDKRCLEVCFPPASAPRFVHISAAPSMKQFVLSKCSQR